MDPQGGRTGGAPTPGAQSTGGQTPTNEPIGGQSSFDAAGSVRDRLRSPGPQSSGGDTRGSAINEGDFEQSDSRADLHEGGRDERQLSASRTPEAAEIQEPRTEDIDPAAAKAAERLVSALFVMSFLGVVGFIVTYIFAPFQYGVEDGNQAYTPLLGIFMMMALGGVGAGAVVWAKRLMPDEEAVQERHPFGSDPDERSATGQALKEGLGQTQLPRRSLLRNTVLLGAGSLALLPVPLLFSFGPFQHKERVLRETSWRQGVRLIRQNGTPVNRDDMQLGGIESVFPDVPRGTKAADSAVLLIRMRPEELRSEQAEGWSVDGYIAYSAICTHLGCPVKLYEQQTHHLLCPCHQSTFAADRGCEVLFGPAARPLPQLAISVDDEGYFVAQGDFDQPVGPSYWERNPTSSYGRDV
jgi:ubiquinol-cytochrome c reductase iron-sulfur subunit